MEYLKFIRLFSLLILILQAIGNQRFNAELESGLLWQTRNEVQIPNTIDGTRFSLVELVGKGPIPWFCLYI